MTVAVANLTTSNTFGQWLTLTNTLATLMTANALTVGGSAAVGNAAVVGTITANNIAADVITTGGSGNTKVQGTVLVIDTTASMVAEGNVNSLAVMTANVLVVTGDAAVTNTLFVNATSSMVGVGPGMTAPNTVFFANGAIGATG